MWENILQLDGELLVGIQHTLNTDWLTPIMKFITAFGEKGLFFIALSVLLIVFKKTRKLGLVAASALLLTYICCNLIIKNAVGRIRPWVVLQEVYAFLPPPGDASFPSGHSADTMGPAFAMWLYTRPLKAGRRRTWEGPDLGMGCEGASRRVMHNVSIALVILSVLIGISRLYLGMHYPTDVLCGWILGMLCALIVYTIFTKIDRKR